MRTTVDIPEKILQECLVLSEAKTKREAIVLSLEDYIRRKKLERLAQAKGKLALKDTWREFRHKR
jgi:hypothetical protein